MGFWIKQYALLLLIFIPFQLYANEDLMTELPVFKCENMRSNTFSIYAQTNSEALNQCLQQAIQYNTEQHKTYPFIYHYYLSKTYLYLSDYREAVPALHQSLKVAVSPKDSIQSMLLLAQAYRENSNTSAAYSASRKALILAKKIKSGDEQIKSNIELAKIAYSIRDSTTANDYLIAAERFVKETTDDVKGAFYYQKAKLVYWYDRHRNFEPTIELLKKSLSYYEKTTDYYKIAATLDFLGSCHIDTNEWEKSKTYYDRSFELKKKLNNPHSIAIALNNYGMFYYTKFEDSTALDYYQQSAALSQDIQALESLQSTYGNIAELYLEIGKRDMA